MNQALYFEETGDLEVQCHLCPHECVLEPGERGHCDVRKNINGSLISENYGYISSIHMDPIEKKPLYHFYPGSHILSIGSIGCNLNCSFCQNYEISQTSIDDYFTGQYFDPEEVVSMALENPNNLGIAFTYNEPIVFFEYMAEIANKSKGLGMKNIMVSNGFINQEPLNKILPLIDGFNIDLKAFSSSFYRNITNGRLEPVKNTLKKIKKAGKHLEITNLLIPSQNVNIAEFTEMVKWIRDELGSETVLHLSRYFPTYKSKINSTPLALMFNFCETAKQYLDYVYLGNVTGCESQNTICGECGKIVISRYGNFIQKNGIDQEGKCVHCNNKIVVS